MLAGFFLSNATSLYSIFRQNGYLEIYDKTSPYLRNCVQVLDDLAVPYKHMNSKETTEKYPIFNLPSHFESIDEKVGGTLMATKCVLAFQVSEKQCHLQ